MIFSIPRLYHENVNVHEQVAYPPNTSMTVPHLDDYKYCVIRELILNTTTLIQTHVYAIRLVSTLGYMPWNKLPRS
jgi:hypothetical protein